MHNLSVSIKKPFERDGDKNISRAYAEDKKLIYGDTGDVVIIKGDERKRALWKPGIVEQLIHDKDGPVCAAQLRSGK